VLAAALASPCALFGQTPGQSVNMVSGTTLPGGDPYLQRQNEPSVAVSTRNPQHLLAGANDYRTVDMPGLPDDEETGDSWVGLFSSLDGGATWRSTLVPGYPQDSSPQGLTSPVKGLAAAADPVVRAGTHGLFYYGFIAFDRGRGVGRFAVARFVDLNDRESGDIVSGTSPIRYAGTSIVDGGNAGQFVDKPWLAVDVPRPGARTCLIPTSPGQWVPGGIVYAAWARFTGARTTKVMLSRSLDCGATWSRPLMLSQTDSINQGLTMAIDPASGALYVAWRRVGTASEPDAIVLAQSSDLGLHFTRAAPVVPAAGRTFDPFDQSSDATELPYKTVFRTTAYPALAVSVDAAGHSRVHLAWAQRTGPRGDARIVLTTSADGGTTWTDPRPVDDGPLHDDFSGSFDRGHQLMPQMTSSAGRLLVLYYDTRLDHTRGVLTSDAGVEDPEAPAPTYRERREPQGVLETPGGTEGADLVFTPVIDDALTLDTRRHTVDVRVAQLDLRSRVDFSAPVFTSARVSQYPFGVTGTSGAEDAGGVVTPPSTLTQLAFNPPNLPLFAKGTTPFVGDYIDIAGLEFVRDSSGDWRFNTRPASAPVFHSVWTSNQDVRPPPDGDWTSYTPPGEPGCVAGREGMRNQNVYSGQITEGLVFSSPQTSKALPAYAPDDPSSVTTFVVEVQNRTPEARWFRLRIADPPASGRASLAPWDASGTLTNTRDTLLPPGSGASAAVFAASSNPVDSIRLEAAEIAGPGGDPVAGGLASVLVLNADPSEPLLRDAAAKTASGQPVATTSPTLASPSISNPSISNPSISNPSISNPSISNPSISNPSISNPSISNPSISNPSISNPSISNEPLAASSVSDATYRVTNDGPTSASYRVKVVGDAGAAPSPLRLLVTKVQSSPTSVGCKLVERPQTTVLLDQVDPAVEPLADAAADPTDASGAASATLPQRAGTFAIPPGQAAYVTLRADAQTGKGPGTLAAVAPVVIPEGGRGAYAAPLMMLPAGGELPPARYGVSYSTELQAFGGKKPYAWTAALPAGLALGHGAGAAAISGVPVTVGPEQVTVQLRDGTPGSGGLSRTFTLPVGRARTTLEVDVPPLVQAGVPVSVAVKVIPEGAGTPSGTVSVHGDDGEVCSVVAPAGTCTLQFDEAGERTIKAGYEGDSSFEPAGESQVGLEVVPDQPAEH
jgi:hypothetical protein